jgi:signal transduction histidine kinase
MRFLRKERALPITLVLGLAAVLIALALLQYRWSGEVSQAEAARMRTQLQSSVNGFRADFYRELVSVCLPFRRVAELDSGNLPARYAEAYRAWKESAAHPDIVSQVYLLEVPAEGRAKLFLLNFVSGAFEPDQGSNTLGELPERLAVTPQPGPGRSDIAQRTERGGTDSSEGRRHGPGARGPFDGPWGIDQKIPALVHPVFWGLPSQQEGNTRPAWPGFLIIQLAPEVLSQRVLASLAARHFGGPEGLEYEVTVLGGDRHPVYSSGPGLGKRESDAADAKVDLFGFELPPLSSGSGAVLLPGAKSFPASGGEHPFHDHPGEHLGSLRFDLLHYSSAEQDWQLVVRHHKGSLDAVVAAARRRNLALSLGVLLVLAATMALIMVASQRAHRLGQLQMEFVTGVSHELRTPLSVIASAADNIADGVVSDSRQLARYATVIKKQALQLNRLIDQVLLFAAGRQNRLQYNMGPLEIGAVIDAVLSGMEELVSSSQVTVERALSPNLPPVMGDLFAVSHCLQNLISNAIKYGGEDRWIAVRAAAATEDGGQYVCVTVEDHGPGIAGSELEEIFQPFYRGAGVASGQTHGTGLGLPLAKSLAEAMGGRLTVVSEPGKGSSFTIHLRAAERGAASAACAGAGPRKGEA